MKNVIKMRRIDGEKKYCFGCATYKMHGVEFGGIDSFICDTCIDFTAALKARKTEERDMPQKFTGAVLKGDRE